MYMYLYVQVYVRMYVVCTETTDTEPGVYIHTTTVKPR